MRQPLKTIDSRTVVLAQTSIDTDQIIAARFLTTTTREGLGAKAFHDWRYDAAGSPIAGAPLNNIDPAEHRILVAGANFGCGSSREHAPWALIDFGFRAVISTSIADIFTANALKNGLLPIEVDAETHARLLGAPGERALIDLETCRLMIANWPAVTFKIEPFARRCLLDGVDELGHLLNCLPAIEAFERSLAPAP